MHALGRVTDEVRVWEVLRLADHGGEEDRRHSPTISINVR